MPELPEVETVVRGLRLLVQRRRVAGVTYAAPHLLQREPKLRTIAGERFERFSRRGKYIVATLTSGRRLLIHLRMSGRLLVKRKYERLGRHDHLVLTLAQSDAKLVFRDVRKFGVVQFMAENGDSRIDSLGPEATTISSRTLFGILQSSRRPVKSLLLDQRRIAGLGNIYADESLHRARIHPAQPAATISRRQAIQLARAIHLVLRLAIKHMGTTFDSYRRADGETGQFVRHLRVYNNAGGKCHYCGSGIRKTRLAGRGTHYCPSCQRLPGTADC